MELASIVTEQESRIVKSFRLIESHKLVFPNFPHLSIETTHWSEDITNADLDTLNSHAISSIIKTSLKDSPENLLNTFSTLLENRPASNLRLELCKISNCFHD